MSKNFDEFLRITGKYKVPFVSFVTNGTLLNNKNISAIVDSNVNQVVISVDGCKKETVESIRNGLLFERWVENIKKLSNALKGSSSCRTALRFNMVVMKSNIKEVLGVLDFALECGVNEFQLRAVHSRNAYDYEFQKHIDVDLSDENAGITSDLLALKPAIQQKIRGTGLMVFFPVDAGVKALKCTYPWFNHYIDSFGNFYPCAYVPSVGNISDVDSYAQLLAKAAPLMQEVKCDKRKECTECNKLDRLYSNFELLESK